MRFASGPHGRLRARLLVPRISLIDGAAAFLAVLVFRVLALAASWRIQ